MTFSVNGDEGMSDHAGAAFQSHRQWLVVQRRFRSSAGEIGTCHSVVTFEAVP